jgi:hypothetical protein
MVRRLCRDARATLEPCAGKLACTVLRRGKPERAYLVRPAKLSEVIRCKPVMDVDLHKPTYRCIVGNEFVLSCRDNVRQPSKHMVVRC